MCTYVCTQICRPLSTALSITKPYIVHVCVRLYLRMIYAIMCNSCVYIYAYAYDICTYNIHQYSYVFLILPVCVYELHWNKPKNTCSMPVAANQVIFLQSSGNLMYTVHVEQMTSLIQNASTACGWGLYMFSSAFSRDLKMFTPIRTSPNPQVRFAAVWFAKAPALISLILLAMAADFFRFCSSFASFASWGPRDGKRPLVFQVHCGANPKDVGLS